MSAPRYVAPWIHGLLGLVAGYPREAVADCDDLVRLIRILEHARHRKGLHTEVLDVLVQRHLRYGAVTPVGDAMLACVAALSPDSDAAESLAESALEGYPDDECEILRTIVQLAELAELAVPRREVLGA